MANESTLPAEAPLSAVERYHILRDQIQHEDNLTTQRLSWLMASQAFLFSAYAIVLNSDERAVNFAFVKDQQRWLISAIPVLAFATAALIYVSLLAGVRALLNLHRHAVSICSRDGANLSLPPIQGADSTRLAGLTSPMLVPPLFIGVWLILVVRGLLR